MKNYLHEITADMTKTVDDLKRRNFENATPDEIELYAKWSSIVAMQDAEIAEHSRIRREESEAAKEATLKESQAAVDALNALADLAREKLKAVKNGQEK